MEVVQVLCMKGGSGDNSYAKNSLFQKKVISLTKPIIEETVTNLCCNNFPAILCIADMGCSSGPNTFFALLEVVTSVDKACKKMGHDQLPEIQVFLNDLPANDFNTIFKSSPSFQMDLQKTTGRAGAESCYVNGVAGSFYGRLFPTKSLHFVHSSYSLQWLSQVPQGQESNKGNIYMASSSPPCVLKAYYDQFIKDFSMFLGCRSKELVEGGSMVLTFLGRSNNEDPSCKECCYIWELLAVALNDMVAEGLIEEEKMDSFNIPQYRPSPAEVKLNSARPSDAYKDGGYNVAKQVRAVAEPLLVSHFGDGIIDEVFNRYREIVADHMSKETTEFMNVTVSVTKRACISNVQLG